MNVNVGGNKNWKKVPESVRKHWKVLDVSGRPDYCHDLNGFHPLPFTVGEVDNYYTSHTLEHVEPKRLKFVFEELHRTLKPGGRIRVVVPDVSIAIRKYVNADRIWLNKHNHDPRPFVPKTALGDLYSWFYSSVKSGRRTGHRMAFDTETLSTYLREVGFKSTTIMQCGICSSIFDGLDFARYRDFSLYMEAER